MAETLATRLQAIDHREALFAAVAGLPTQEGDWSIPEPILVHAGLRHDVPRARQIVMAFASWAADAVRSLPFAPRAQLQGTDFNDYYKLVMSRVEYLYQKTLPAQGAATDAQLYPICTFETQLRRRPQYTKNGVTRTLGVFDTAPSPDRAYSYADVRAAFVDALRAVGARRFDAATLRSLLESRAPSMAGMEESLRALTDEWVAKLCEVRLETLHSRLLLSSIHLRESPVIGRRRCSCFWRRASPSPEAKLSSAASSRATAACASSRRCTSSLCDAPYSSPMPD